MMMGRWALLAACAVVAVDRAKFRTCQQLGFCRRFNEMRAASVAERPQYTAQSATLSADKLTASVALGRVAGRKLLLMVSGYKTGAVRLQLHDPDEAHPAKRYTIPSGDVLVADVHSLMVPLEVSGTDISFSFTSPETGASHTVAVAVGANGQIHAKLDGRTFQVWNRQSLLSYESYRPKDQHPLGVADCSASVDATCWGNQKRDHGLWAETFSGHSDSKPYGPQSIGVDIFFDGATSLVGLPEHTNNLRLTSLTNKNEPYRFFNLDVFEYELDSGMGLYGAIPMVTALHKDAKAASSVFWLNPSDTFVWVSETAGGQTTDWVSESGVFDAFVLPGPSPAETVLQYTALTGPAAMPPLFALGKHQCRWNYVDTADVEQVDRNMDKHDLPYDVLWLDIEHTDGKRYFTWDKRHFPEPEAMQKKISAKGRKMVTIIDPHIKSDTNYHVYKGIPLWVQKKTEKMIDDPNDAKPQGWDDEPQEILDPNAQKPETWDDEEDGPYVPAKIPNPNYKGAWTPRRIPDPNGGTTDFDGWCWPGTSKYPDFTSSKVREYWATLFAFDKYGGSTPDLYTWNDMNEPSVFNGPEVTMPLDAVHEGNVEHRDVHNLYGMYHHRATFEGHKFRNPNARPFVLSRSFFAGTQRYGAIWTGDNFALWSHYKISVPMLLSMSVAGLSFVGADVGGFFKHPEKDLITRWHQFGALAYPFYRSHAHLETPRREPWMYGDDAVAKIRAVEHVRYQMMPIWYTLFAEHAFHGAAIIRPLWYDFMSDVALYESEAQDREMLVGKDLLVVAADDPKTEPTVSVVLPGPGEWYDYWTGAKHPAGELKVPNTWEHVPVYARAGAILVRKARARRSTSAQVRDPYSLSVYLDAQGEARTALYVDDFGTMAYTTGVYVYQELRLAGGVLQSAPLTLGREGLSGAPPAPTALPEVGLAVERIDVYGSSATAASFVAADGATTALTTSRVGDVLTVKLPPIKIGEHGWKLQLS